MIAKDKRGVLVFNRHSSHLHCDIEDVKHAISLLQLEGNFIKTTYQFDDRFGFSECVETTDSDKILYERRPKRDGVTRFVLDREPIKTNILSLILFKRKNYYVLATAFWGGISEPEIWDEKAFLKDKRGYHIAKEKSLQFWSRHALIYKKPA